MTVRIGLAIFLVLPLAAQKKPVTIEAIASMRSQRGGFDGAPIWAPDGKAFLHRQGEKVMLYDVGAKSERELLSMATLTQAAAKTDPPERFEWENRGVREEAIQWMAS